MARKAGYIESANYSEFLRRHDADVPFHSMNSTIAIGAHVESTNHKEFLRRHDADVPFYSMKCTIAIGVHVDALNRSRAGADLTAPIATLLSEYALSRADLTANIGRYYGIQEYSLASSWIATRSHGCPSYPHRIGKRKISGAIRIQTIFKCPKVPRLVPKCPPSLFITQSYAPPGGDPFYLGNSHPTKWPTPK